MQTFYYDMFLYFYYAVSNKPKRTSITQNIKTYYKTLIFIFIKVIHRIISRNIHILYILTFLIIK